MRRLSPIGRGSNGVFEWYLLSPADEDDDDELVYLIYHFDSDTLSIAVGMDATEEAVELERLGCSVQIIAPPH
ncbi:hypothetical protein [Streptomyces synnematoformans]|uniref:Uncharacterized protein n=1 Tax=Streptomyces synnematoformans TaxID=415721 RepID=A0ABN2YVX3_9ACTN